MKTKMKISIFHKFTERLLIFITINSFFTTLLFILRDICISRNSDLINLITIAIVFLSAVLVYSIFLIFFNSKSSTANFIRLLFFYSIFIGAVILGLRHFIYFSGTVTFICSIIQTILYKKIMEAFFSHDMFEFHCQEKNNSQLQKELYDYNIYLSEAAEGYKQNRSMLIILLIILILGATACISTSSRLSIISIIFFFIFFISMFCNFFLYSHYVREATFASNGFVNVFDFRLKIFFTAVWISALSFMFAIALSSNHSLIKFSWIAGLFEHKNEYAVEPRSYEDQVIDMRMNEIKAFQNAFTPDKKAEKANTWFAIICGVLLGGSIIWFFIKPFVTKVFSSVLKKADLKHVIKRFFKTLGQVFYKLFHLKLKPVIVNGKDALRFQTEMTEFLKASKKSKEKKAELDRLTKQFVKLIDWGTSNGYEYSKNLAPAEYTQKMNNEYAIQAGFLFEKALYDKECLSENEEKDFSQLINKVCG